MLPGGRRHESGAPAASAATTTPAAKERSDASVRIVRFRSSLVVLVVAPPATPLTVKR
jgi:hypothetical protein